MNWIKENKFLSGFLAVMIVGVAVLGYLLLSAKSRYADVSTQYDEQANDLNRLQSMAPFPAEPNLRVMEEERKKHQEAVVALQTDLSKNTIPVEPLSEVQFQDRLRDSVARVRTKAAERQTALPEKGFYMGFDLYENEPPNPTAAPLLGRQLKAIELVVMQLIENRAVSLINLQREPLPEEGGVKPANDDAQRSGKGGREDDTADKGVRREPFEVTFMAHQDSFRTILNNIVGSKTQFYIPRVVRVKNEKEKAPTKAETGAGAAPVAAVVPTDPATAAGGVATAAASPAGAGAAAPTAPAGAPAAAASTEALKYVVGDERLEVTMRLEIVDFGQPAATASTK